MKTNLKLYIFLWVAGFLFAACSNTKYLPKGENLYVGAKINFDDTINKKKDLKILKSTLLSKTRPKPNKAILNLRFKLWFYNIAGTPTGKGLRYFIKNKLGEPPVLASSLKLSSNDKILKSFMIAEGYLQANVTSDTLTKNRKTTAIYNVEPAHRYQLNKISFPVDSSEIAIQINKIKDKSLLKPNGFYNLETFLAERNRIDNHLKEQGYFYFNPDFLLMQVDSTLGNNLVDVDIVIKNNTPLAALHPYSINKINVYPNYNLQTDSVVTNSQPVIFKDFIIKDPDSTFKPSIFERLIFFKKGETYSRVNHNYTLNRLINLNAFKFVKAEFTSADSVDKYLLNSAFYMTPLKKNALSGQIGTTQKSNNFVGSELKFTSNKRNVFRGAELLAVSAGFGFEQQVSGQLSGVNSYTVSADAILTFPKFIIPFFTFKSTNAFIPRTQVLVGFQKIIRTSLYRIDSYKAEYGYNWKENIKKEHKFNPIALNYVRTADTTAAFAEYLKIDPSIRRNFDNQFIIGSNYTFTFNNQVEQNRRNNIFFKAGLDFSGNLLGAVLSKSADGQKKILNTPISQYLKFDFDTRNYYKISKGVTFANRFIAGFGFAYGNSFALPFVKQFFAGGSDDIRAFRARSLGPGSYDYKSNVSTNPNDISFSEQSGDIKLMLNSELRFKIVSIFQGALFVDAGNVWLTKQDPNNSNFKPGAVFNFSSFTNDIAVGTGFGLRADATIFVIRIDAALPLRKPYLPNGQRWVYNDINLGSSTWRKENLIFNIGIGYPF